MGNYFQLGDLKNNVLSSGLIDKQSQLQSNQKYANNNKGFKHLF